MSKITIDNNGMFVDIVSRLVKAGIQFEARNLSSGDWEIVLTGGY